MAISKGILVAAIGAALIACQGSPGPPAVGTEDGARSADFGPVSNLQNARRPTSLSALQQKTEYDLKVPTYLPPGVTLSGVYESVHQLAAEVQAYLDYSDGSTIIFSPGHTEPADYSNIEVGTVIELFPGIMALSFEPGPTNPGALYWVQDRVQIKLRGPHPVSELRLIANSLEVYAA